MAKAYSRGLQLALGGGGQSPLRFAVMELRRMMDEMRRGDNMPSLSRLEWKRLRTATPEKSLEIVLEQAQMAHNQCEAWAAELNVVLRALVASTTLGMGGFWDGVADDTLVVAYEDATDATMVRGCSLSDGHDWRYVRTSKDGVMSMYKCQVCGDVQVSGVRGRGGDVVRQGAEVTCSAYGDGHDWSYVRESHDGMMAMYRCKICGEEVVM